MTNKICGMCNKEKPLEEFYSPGKKCKECKNKLGKQRKELLKQQRLCLWCMRSTEENHVYCPTCLEKNKNRYTKEEWKKRDKNYRIRLKMETFRHYGNGVIECFCCKNKYLEHLCLDHIDGNGNKERLNIYKETGRLSEGTGIKFYRRLKDLGYPSGYRVSCWNCNHKLNKRKECNHGKNV